MSGFGFDQKNISHLLHSCKALLYSHPQSISLFPSVPLLSILLATDLLISQ